MNGSDGVRAAGTASPTALGAERHLVAVWNPAYAADAMEAHLAVLLDLVQRYEHGEIADDQLYVWWGKVRSPHRQQAYPHLSDVRAIARALKAREREEVQLYLTDYRSLYVADVGAIVEGNLRDAEHAHAPAYYRTEELRCDFWFRLDDVRRLVTDDTLAVVGELKALRNVHYADRPVSLYGGMVELPLVVTRPDGRRYFDETERDRLLDGRLWAEFDAESGTGVGSAERELRENRFGEVLWAALEPAARTFVATGERLFREHRGDPAFDFAPVLGSFAKALEVQCNAVLRRGLDRAPDSVRLANVGGRTVDVTSFRALSLGELARAIGGERGLNRALAARLEHGAWFTGSLPAILDAFAEVRNPGAHTARVDRATATFWRNRLVGVGCVGDFLELARVHPTPHGTARKPAPAV